MKKVTTNQSDITLAPRSREKLLDDDFKFGTIELTRGEKAILADWMNQPSYEVFMKVWIKQRAAQVAFTSFNMSRDTETIEFYRGKGSELDHIPKAIKKLVDDFRKQDGKDQPADEATEPTGRQLVSSSPLPKT